MCLGKHPFLEIDAEFEAMIPPHSKDEFKQLETNILADGQIKEAVTVWGNIIVDGMTRFKIARKHDLPFHITRKEFADNDAAKMWMVLHQMGRRNLTPEKMSLLRAEYYELTKKINGKHDGPKPHKGESSDNLSLDSAAKKVADETGVSERTVKRDAAFASDVKKLAPEVKEAVVSGDVKATRKQVHDIAKKPAKEQKAAVKELKKQEAKPKPPKSGKPTGWHDDAKIQSKIGELVRMLDAKAAAQGKCKEFTAALESLRVFNTAWLVWKKVTA